ncbi:MULTISPECIES: TIGR00296 family protein [Metallosphaera]|uniref:TIGR00296 family protein n=1 Tax=Metallosphaera TaxID=41980 RepID=UPI001F052BA2|nr:TIGR00296 family protein [Metallosphaera sedula]MCH1770911.1 TIGR00296 family protein [Metallosphaera sedula]MCP6729268.1 TIGR00296 family protein [Metallosphaera sedula]
MNLLSIEDIDLQVGKKLVKIARSSIERRLRGKGESPKFEDPVLDKYGMAFVTLESDLGGKYELRGCIGYIEAVAPIKEIVSKAALAAAFSDPRFPPVRPEELDQLVIEVTILTKPENIEVDDRRKLPSMIEVGKDGLIVEKGIMYSGLLLPQVPVEYCWDAETFLAETCIKAGLLPDCWLENSVKIKKFQGIIIREESPNGNVTIMRPSDIKCKLPLTLNE